MTMAEVQSSLSQETFASNTCDKEYADNCKLEKGSQTHTQTITIEHVCDKCQKSFCNKTEHICSHVTETKLVCEKYDKHFTLNDSLKRHIRDVHSEKNNFCSIGPEALSDESGGKRQSCLHDNQRYFICDKCDKHFTRNSNLKRHVQNVHSEENNFCSLGPEALSDESGGKKLSCPHDNQKYFICDKCDKHYTQFSSLKRHIENVHSEENNFRDICPEALPDESGVNKHNCPPSIQKTVVCNKCQKVFSSNWTLYIHISSVHGGKKTIHACNVCEKTFLFRSRLKKHIYSHSSNRPFGCDICNLHFSEKSQLKKHCNKHTDEKLYLCVICKRGFRIYTHLKRHLLTHTGEKPYVCEFCNRGFRANGTLTAHRRIHTGEKPYTCTICENKFRTRGCLNSHLRSHTGEKPYECDKCSLRFSHSFHLYDHMRTHTREKPFVCEICQKAFSLKRNLQRHFQRHSRIIPIDSPYTEVTVEDANCIVPSPFIAENITKVINTSIKS